MSEHPVWGLVQHIDTWKVGMALVPCTDLVLVWYGMLGMHRDTGQYGVPWLKVLVQFENKRFLSQIFH